MTCLTRDETVIIKWSEIIFYCGICALSEVITFNN